MTPDNGRLAVVTGAGGHIGGNLVRALLAGGRNVRAIVYRDTKALDGLDVERVQANVLDAVSLRKAFDGADIVYHLAAKITLLTRDPLTLQTNIEGTRNVIDVCVALGIRRVVHFSSIHAFSPHPMNNPVDESRARCDGRGICDYDLSKAEGERIVLAASDRGLDAVILNPTGVVGPHDYKPSAMGRVVRDVLKGRLPIIVAGGFNWVDVRDVCDGAMAVERLGRKGEQFLLGGHYLKVSELVTMIADVGGVKPPRLEVPIGLARLGVPVATLVSSVCGVPPRFTKVSLAALKNHQQISHMKATENVGYQPRPIQDTIHDTVAWFKESGNV